MKRTITISTAVAFALAAVAFTAVNLVARQQAINIVTITGEEKRIETETPADYGMPDYDDLTVTTEDGVEISFWYAPGTSDAAVIMAHGITGFKGNMLEEMQLLHEAGFHVAALDTRAHGRSEGEVLSFGYFEALDIGAVYEYVAAQPGVDPERVGLYGESMGGSGVLHYGAQNPEVAAVAANSPFGSLEGTVDTSVEFFTPLPARPFGDFIQFWAEQQYEGDMTAEDVTPIAWAKAIAPRPVFVTVAGRDNVVAVDEWITADLVSFGSNFTIWYEQYAGHAAFSGEGYLRRFGPRLVTFFQEHLQQ